MIDSQTVNLLIFFRLFPIRLSYIEIAGRLGMHKVTIFMLKELR